MPFRKVNRSGNQSALSRMTDYESDIDTDCSSSGEEDTSFADLYEETCNSVEALLKAIGEVEDKLRTLQRPLGDLYLSQLGDMQFSETSPFRFQKFKFSNPAVAQALKFEADTRYTFADICASIRTTLAAYATSIDTSTGAFDLPNHLKGLLGIQEREITFPLICLKLRRVLV